MSGERDLDKLLANLTAKLDEGVYVFATLPGRDVPEGMGPRMRFEEAEGTTLILLRSVAESHGLPHEFPCRMITLEVHSALDAVGFLARVAAELTRHGISVNPVAGFHHDHLFVPVGREKDAMRALEGMAKC